jgi:hypothetical protein
MNYRNILFHRNTFIGVLALSMFFYMACASKNPIVNPETKSLTRKTADYDGETLHKWMETAHQIVKDKKLSTPEAARIYGYLGMTAWESVYGGIPNAQSLAEQLNDYFDAVVIDPDTEYDWVVVMAASMKAVMPELIEDIAPTQQSLINLLAELQENQRLAQGVSQEVFQDSRALGQKIGQYVVRRTRRDGYATIQNIIPVLPARTSSTRWYWDPATLNQKPTEPMWGTLRTFVIDNTQVCEETAPYVFSTDFNSDFYKDITELFEIPQNSANKTIAYHWENGAGRSTGAAGHWMSIAEQVLRAKNSNLADCAKTYCLTGFAVSDACAHSWFVKYKYNLLRPITFIREELASNWNSTIFTPPYPEYISASAAIGGAAPLVIASVTGDVAFLDKTHLGSALYTPEGGPFILSERSFPSLTKAGEEQAQSRLLGGVSGRHSIEIGLEAGKCIGKEILATLNFGN